MKYVLEKKPRARKTYNPAEQTPVLHCSICTGEETAGFRDNKTGHFEDVMLISSDRDLERFRQEYGIGKDTEIKKEY